VLLETGLDPGCLVLEVTENVLVEDSIAAGASLQLLRDLQVKVAVDDFGTAYSSLARLKHWPVDTLKVDRSFVAGLGEDEEDEVLVSGILSMASGLGLTVVAEGVETSKQLASLRAMGCSRAQGYYFSRPLPSEEVASLLERHL
jgi:EAL domain-containing protein (putative c-di-GMP-specific phosphodiesterase class I)